MGTECLTCDLMGFTWTFYISHVISWVSLGNFTFVSHVITQASHVITCVNVPKAHISYVQNTFHM